MLLEYKTLIILTNSLCGIWHNTRVGILVPHVKKERKRNHGNLKLVFVIQIKKTYKFKLA